LNVVPRLRIFHAGQPVGSPSELLSGPSAKAFISQLREAPERPIVIVDMPPILVSDDVISFLPQADCAILIAAERETAISEIEAAERLLEPTNVVGIVLTKSNDRQQAYY
jgi:protein-tyrosine kinase